ncbi:AraC family transcriptional regulator [Paenibacillus sp. LHD-117]|uniref:helix-turn-helix domain-containing protein n=1 Tax=Paenibacillus sp. LHD-117 TaxID=3071412 RepID=UPI0027E1B888|nr:AraC family transcriptional regulator [Paenibacillus sp. LHD-117]MDQ6420549.1 AraC family transcriptional regulator [Paenibacillus sp. LHD-117]
MNGLFRSVATRFHGSSVLFKLLIVNLIFIVLLSGLLAFNYSYLKSNVKNQVLQTNEEFLNQLSRNMAEEWQAIRDAVYNFSVSVDTKFLSINPKQSRSYYPELLAYKKKLTETNLGLPFRAQISAYFPKQDLVVSSDGTRSLRVFYDSLGKKNKEEICRGCLLQSEEMEHLFNFNQMILYTYRLFPEGYIFVQIDKEQLAAFLSNETKLLDNIIVLGDKTNHPIVSTTALDSSVMDHVRSLPNAVAIEGKKYSPIVKNANFFTYTVLFPESQMQEKLKTTNWYTFGLFAVFLAANMAFLLVNWSMFRPLRHLARTFNQWTTPLATNNEFAIISDRFKVLNSATASMQLEITEQSEIMEHNALLRLIADKNYAMKPSVKQMLQGKFDSYVVLSFIEENNEGKSSQEYAPILEAALNLAGPCIGLHGYNDKTIFIASCVDLGEMETLVVRTLSDMSPSNDSGFALCGISSLHTRLEDVRTALRESMEAIFKHVPDLDGMTRVVLYQDWGGERASVIHLSIDKEQELVNYALKGNSDAINQFFDKTMEKTFNQLTFEQFLNMMRYLHDLLLVIMNSKKIGANEVWESPPDFSRTFHLPYLFKQVRTGYLFVAKRSALADTPLMDQIKQYIDNHYANPDLSLTLIADRFGITHVYLSTYFKKHSGHNFNYYMHLIRIQAAHRLIESHPNLAMKEIAERVGYSNAGTFIRHFKKVSGTTPTQHVKLLQE